MPQSEGVRQFQGYELGSHFFTLLDIYYPHPEPYRDTEISRLHLMNESLGYMSPPEDIRNASKKDRSLSPFCCFSVD